MQLLQCMEHYLWRQLVLPKVTHEELERVLSINLPDLHLLETHLCNI